jgi:hypothetical protein
MISFLPVAGSARAGVLLAFVFVAAARFVTGMRARVLPGGALKGRE